MSRSELHDWECTIKSLCGDNTDEMLAVAQDIYNTAFVRGKNCISLEQQPCGDCINREAVIEWLKDEDIIKTKNQEENARRELTELSSVTPNLQEWLFSFNTDSATECFTAVQELKKKLEGDSK